jgi:RecJ-like exonuclease
VSAKSSTPDYDFSEYKGIDYNNTIYYPASELVGQREVTVAIECNGNCTSELEYYYIAKDGYVMVNETNTKFDVRIGESDGFFLVYNISSVNGQIPTTFLSVTSSGIEDFEPFLVYGESTENPLIKMEKMLQQCIKIAQKVERESLDIKKAEYMQDKIGNVYEGIISGVTAFGLFVELENTVEGLIRFDNLGDEFYIYDDKHKQLIGEHTKETYKIGDKITIRVIEANKLLRKVAFERYDE